MDEGGGQADELDEVEKQLEKYEFSRLALDSDDCCGGAIRESVRYALSVGRQRVID